MSYYATRPKTSKPPPGWRPDMGAGINRGLVGWWPFNEGGGSIVADIGGSGNHGPLTNMDPSTDWVGSPYGSALDFDGSDDGIYLGSNSRLDNLAQGAMTVAALVYPRTTGGGGTGRIAAHRAGGGSGAGWLFFTDPTASLGAQTAGAGVLANSRGADNAITLNAWNSVAFTYNDSGDRLAHIYANGKEIAYDTHAAAASSPTDDSGGELVLFNSQPGNRTFDGVGADIRIWSRALSAHEVRQLHEQPYG